MEIKLSKELQSVLRYARDEAMRTGSYSVGTDHLMLAILRHRDNDAYRTLAALDIDLDAFKKTIDDTLFQERQIPFCDMDKIVPTNAARSVLKIAAWETLRFGGHRIMTTHLLLAVSRVEDNASSAFFRSKNISRESLGKFMDANGFITKITAQEPLDLTIIAGALGEQLSRLLSDSHTQTNILN